MKIFLPREKLIAMPRDNNKNCTLFGKALDDDGDMQVFDQVLIQVIKGVAAISITTQEI